MTKITATQLVTEIVKHLPNQHDQSSHAGKGAGTSAPATASGPGPTARKEIKVVTVGKPGSGHDYNVKSFDKDEMTSLKKDLRSVLKEVLGSDADVVVYDDQFKANNPTSRSVKVEARSWGALSGKKVDTGGLGNKIKKVLSSHGLMSGKTYKPGVYVYSDSATIDFLYHRGWDTSKK